MADENVTQASKKQLEPGWLDVTEAALASSLSRKLRKEKKMYELNKLWEYAWLRDLYPQNHTIGGHLSQRNNN